MRCGNTRWAIGVMAGFGGRLILQLRAAAPAMLKAYCYYERLDADSNGHLCRL